MHTGISASQPPAAHCSSAAPPADKLPISPAVASFLLAGMPRHSLTGRWLCWNLLRRCGLAGASAAFAAWPTAAAFLCSREASFTLPSRTLFAQGVFVLFLPL